jgi:hypothetical protein
MKSLAAVTPSKLVRDAAREREAVVRAWDFSGVLSPQVAEV